MMLRPRRPLLRAAMIGGVGYAGYQAGKHVDARQAEPPSDADRYETLSKLKELLDSGVLTQEEFDNEKRQVLRGG